MASPSRIFLVFAFTLIAISLTSATRNAPTNDGKWLGHFDRSVLIPGFGRVMIPKKGDKSPDYNPITRTHGGNGASIPTYGSTGGGSTGHSYVPGGDDTFVPNPAGGLGVPAAPAPSGH